MHWVLILMLTSGFANGGVASRGFNFEDKAACEKAGQAAKATFGKGSPDFSYGHAWYVCVEDATSH